MTRYFNVNTRYFNSYFPCKHCIFRISSQLLSNFRKIRNSNSFSMLKLVLFSFYLLFPKFVVYYANFISRQTFLTLSPSPWRGRVYSCPSASSHFAIPYIPLFFIHPASLFSCRSLHPAHLFFPFYIGFILMYYIITADFYLLPPLLIRSHIFLFFGLF